ncbi:type VI secretion system lipoprotein TssJ [candidate division CSSED10-310 bacterium]|uniref:Type VI secretion system lipoprotein TssJ n=1 Tax=candidate division CSSED10-310 bacterium TaxID=2855610 RepID=A0ABV6YX44_UNCC1
MIAPIHYPERIIIKVTVILAIITVLFSCSSLPDPEPAWDFGQKAIEISYEADDSLNLYKNRPHTLAVIIYQMSDTNAFDDLSAYQEGLKKLLKNELFDPSVQARRRIIVKPGEKDTLVLDRAEEAKWVGLVAGYYDLHPDKSTSVIKIPVMYNIKGLIKEKKEATIKKVYVHVLFGRYGFEEVEMK